jgi:GT2 family glycosyltransferase
LGVAGLPADVDAVPVRQHVDCAIVVVSYNSGRHIATLLDSIPGAADGLSVRSVVVDNDSVDDSAEIVRSRGDAVLVRAGANIGYAGAINVGRVHAGPCSSILILNPDVVLEPGSITRLYEALAGPGVGVTVPMLLNDDGTLFFTLRRDPSPMRALGDAVCGLRLPRRPGWLSETVRDPAAYGRPRDVAWAGGAVMLISAECARAVGPWDERFFLYSEETDFATRTRRAGFRIRYVPSARVRHEDGGSGRSTALGTLLAVNRVRFYEKHHPRAAAALFRGAVALHYALRLRDPDQRAALRAVCRRSCWSELPGRSEHLES